jgi:2-keto-4-pentenoate hydratase/2-oxohepta-3-ene-1,7-dioic acid hydratase in catechol pathway
LTSQYRLLSYRQDSGPVRAGVLIADRVRPASEFFEERDGVEATSVLGLLRSWDRAHERLKAAALEGDVGRGLPLSAIELAAPILYPASVFSAGANYLDHFEEMAEGVRRVTGKHHAIEKAAEPFITLKTSTHSIVGTNASVRIPGFSSHLDWEAEIGVVIGRPARNLTASRWQEAVAGYVIVNDLSARDKSKRLDVPFTFDWFGQKCFAGSAPMGPWLTPAEYISDPYALSIKLWVNGILKQDGNSRNMVFSIGELIEYLSARVELLPGDVIMTGCPAGVGVTRGERLSPGDEVRIEVTDCGTLVTQIEAA